MSQGEPTPWGTFDEMGRPHYLYLHNGVVFQATVGELNGIYAAWLQPGTDNRLMHNIVSSPAPSSSSSSSSVFCIPRRSHQSQPGVARVRARVRANPKVRV